EELMPHFEYLYQAHRNKDMQFANVFAREFKKRIAGGGYSDEDILHTFHVYLERLLVEKLAGKVERYGRKHKNLCFVGGCALNIKWNSALRETGLFSDVWVPPFPNDSGSAIGAACCEMIHATGRNALDWNVYSGPPVMASAHADGWSARPASLAELARLLHRENEPVVFLHGNAELGPRALGNRSILAAATEPAAKQVLNQIKKREDYRPVAPICLEAFAPQLFAPGSRDPYMLFDHAVRPEWLGRIPAVCHLDGTARLQTVSAADNPVMHELLTEYRKLSGIPLLCNTSANYKGKGFFPDVASAIAWNEVNYVWSNYVLYEKQDKIVFEDLKYTPTTLNAC
ncbi:MAG: hypothetical protein ICV83_13530, partial [Cytophagales bacterium]|nr:hypothetical protein [Cytophagales bacterium]